MSKTNEPKPRRRAAQDSAPESAPPISLPGWVAPLAFGVLAVALFREFVFSDEMLYGGDTLALGYAARALYAESLQALGRVPGWAPHLLGGTPFIEALSAGDSLYPPSLLLLLLTAPHRALGWKLVLHVFLAGLLFYGWVRSIGGSRAAALLGGTAYMLAPFLVGFVHPGHDGKIFVTALAPLMFWVTERHFRQPGAASFAAIGLSVALIIYTTHFQMAYFLFGGVGLYAIFRSVQIGRGVDEIASGGSPRAGGVRFALFLAAAIAGAAGAAWQLVPAADYVTEYSRRIQTTETTSGQTGRQWSSSFSMNPEEVMSLVVPEFAGNNAGGPAWADGTYWGRNGFKDNHNAAGLIALLLAAVSFAGAARRQLRGFLVGLGTLALLFALGANTPVWGIFYEIVPGIRLFRAPGMVAFLFGFAAITMAALGLDRIVMLLRTRDEAELERVQKILWGATAGLGVLAVLITSGVFTAAWTTVVYPGIGERQLQILAAHMPNIVRGSTFAVMLSAALAGIVWGLRQGRVPIGLGVGLIVVLAAADALRVDQPFVQTMDFYSWSQPDPNIRAMLDREEGSDEPYRFWSMVRGDQDVSAAAHGIELAAGHHPNDLSRYRELIGMVGSGRATNLGHVNIRRILNVRYILWPDLELGQPAPEGATVSRTQLSDGRVYQTLIADIGLPRARLVGSAVVKSDDEAVPYILGPEHDPEQEVVLASEAPIALEGSPVTGHVRWVDREADRMTLAVESDRPALLVIADNWFPAWRATVDGEEAEVLRAYHTLRAVPVPAGTSTVEMWYESPLLQRSRALSLIALLGLAGCGVFGTVRGRTAAGREETDVGPVETS